MSRDVQLQADVSSISVQGLGAFTSILATLSADNIAPVALVQMEKLGNSFHISGKYAEEVKGLLQRCRDVRVNHFALFIGWRKIDTASLMAESTGGQSVALLSLCLTNLFWAADTGVLFLRLCSKVLPHSSNISSASQLADVATLLAGKVECLGFGNLLAEEVKKIHDVYDSLGLKSKPTNLLEAPSPEFVIELLEKVSQVFSTEDKFCRIVGTYSMGYIISLLQALFHRDTTLTIEGVVIQDTEYSRIRCEIVYMGTNKLTEIRVETLLSQMIPITIPIETVRPTVRSLVETTPLKFRWHGCLADYLRLAFMNIGLRCQIDVLQACCDLITLLPGSIDIHPDPKPGEKNIHSQKMPLTALLGAFPQARMCKVCEDLFECTPSVSHADTDIQEPFARLIAMLSRVLNDFDCYCTEKPCDFDGGQKFGTTVASKSTNPCPRAFIWRAVDDVLGFCLYMFFVDASRNVTVSLLYEQRPNPLFNVASAIKTGQFTSMNPRNLFDRILGLMSSGHVEDYSEIMQSSDSCTLYPTVLSTLELPASQHIRFSLVEGRVVHEGRYHRHVLAAGDTARPTAKESLMETVTPSNVGVYSGNPLVTIYEGFNMLELSCSVQYARNEVKLNLKAVLLGYIALQWSTTCNHRVTDHLDPKHKAIATPVSSPAADGRPGVVMTRWNPVAQFLSCDYGYNIILQRDCCLNCAVEGLGDRPDAYVIVG